MSRHRGLTDLLCTLKILCLICSKFKQNRFFSLYIAPFYLLFCAIIIYILITIYEKLNIINIICSLYNLPLKELREKRRVCKY